MRVINHSYVISILCLINKCFFNSCYWFDLRLKNIYKVFQISCDSRFQHGVLKLEKNDLCENIFKSHNLYYFDVNFFFLIGMGRFEG